MQHIFPDGMWPVMITPFTRQGEIDYKALAAVIDWYIENGSDGLFATCQSSEMFYLSLRERIQLTRFVREHTGGRVPVIASGHVSYAPEDQIREICAMADEGVDAVILISNRLAHQEEPDDVFLKRLDALLKAVPEDLALGFYECPYPYKRILSPQIVRYCVESKRFYFIKDTSCSMESISEKLSLIRGSHMKLYNANTATLLESLRAGAAGYSGVMANYHPALYAWLLHNWKTNPDQADFVQGILTMSSFIEMKNYPASAKCYMAMEGIDLESITRKHPYSQFSPTERLELLQLHQLSERLMQQLDGAAKK
jgi:4-hydroxy-tetrahydrodipicolinate synthase